MGRSVSHLHRSRSDRNAAALFPQLIIPIRGSNYVTTPMGIALPWEQAVRDHNANQPVDVIVHFVRLCCSTPLLKGPSRRLISRWHMHADPIPSPFLAGALLHFSVITAEKTGEEGGGPTNIRGRRIRGSPSNCRSSIKLPPPSAPPSILFFSFFLAHSNRDARITRPDTCSSIYCYRDLACLTEMLATGVSEPVSFIIQVSPFDREKGLLHRYKSKVDTRPR